MRFGTLVRLESRLPAGGGKETNLPRLSKVPGRRQMLFLTFAVENLCASVPGGELPESAVTPPDSCAFVSIGGELPNDVTVYGSWYGSILRIKPLILPSFLRFTDQIPPLSCPTTGLKLQVLWTYTG